MDCLTDCMNMGPPPDSIIFLPPPPAPSYLSHPFSELLLNITLCSPSHMCISGPSLNTVTENGDHLELPRKDIESWSVSRLSDDTWVLIMAATSVGVLILGTLIAMFLLKCRELNVFGQCSMNVQEHRQTKNEIQQECMGNTSNAKLHPPDNGLYHRSSNIQDNRMVWATLTPRGTQHFISENYPANIVDFVENEDHYEIIDNYNIQPVLTSQSPAYHTYLKGLALVKLGRNKTYNDASFTDYEYEDPTPLIESYQMNDIETKHSGHFSTLTNADMRCMTDSTLRRGFSFRPCVSSPTRIEHPNLPPLNLYPYNTLKTTSINYKNVDSASLPRYGC